MPRRKVADAAWKKERAAVKKRKTTVATRDARILTALKAGDLYQVIADREGVTVSWVARIARLNELPQRRPRGPRKPKFKIERAAPAPAASGFPWGDMRPGDSVFMPTKLAAPVMTELPNRIGFTAEAEPGGVRIRRVS